jgi:hypothetical protein
MEIDLIAQGKIKKLEKALSDALSRLEEIELYLFSVKE